jgi:hypothetical protein
VAAIVTIVSASIDGDVRATLPCSRTTRACPTGTPEALACGTNVMQHVRTESTAAVTLKIPRLAPRDLRAM